MGETKIRKSKSKKSKNVESSVQPSTDGQQIVDSRLRQLALEDASGTVATPTDKVATSRVENTTPVDKDDDNDNEDEDDDESDQIPTYIEVRSTAAKGLAAFATRKIVPGTLILSEQPLIRLTQAEEDTDTSNNPIQSPVDTKFRTTLSKTSQKSYLSLYDSHKTDFSRVKSIYYSNCYNLSGRNLPSRSSPGGSVIGTVASRINHGCVPNVQFSFDEARNRMLFHAVRPIPRGKEIVSNYDTVYELKAQRRRKHTLYYGFQCDCEACEGRTEFWAKSDERRRGMIDAMRTVRECDGRVVKSSGAGAIVTAAAVDEKEKDDDVQARINAGTAVAALERLEGLLSKEGILGMPLADCYAKMATWAERKGDTKSRKKALEMELRVTKTACGARSARCLLVAEKLAKMV